MSSRVYTAFKTVSAFRTARACGLITGVFIVARHRVKCDGERLKPPDPAKLTHTYLIRNAVSQTVNAAITLLNQTLVALEDAEVKYAKALQNLKVLLEYNMVVLGDPDRQDQVWVEIIRVKGEIANLNHQRKELEFLYNNVEKTLYAAAETAFCSGAEQITSVANERLFSAKTTKDNLSKESLVLESQVVQLEASTIDKTMEAQKRRLAEENTSHSEASTDAVSPGDQEDFEQSNFREKNSLNDDEESVS